MVEHASPSLIGSHPSRSTTSSSRRCRASAGRSAQASNDAWMAGVTLDELVSRTGRDRRLLEVMLHDEVASGRVVVEDRRYALRPGCLPPGVAEALRGLSAPDVAVLANGHRHRLSGGRVRPSGRANLNFVVYRLDVKLAAARGVSRPFAPPSMKYQRQNAEGADCEPSALAVARERRRVLP
jgi:hypothetical protein